MARTDYSRIAAIYDDAEMRHVNPPDLQLKAALERHAGPFHFLDVACGTGNHLAAQRAAFPEERIAWHGVDASEAMLERARPKLVGVELRHAHAEALPYDDGAFDYLNCNFAFHHFEDKPRALDEMRRVLGADGALRIANIAPEHMRDWWVFQYFAGAWEHDALRFWPVDVLVHQLELRGFRVQAAIHITHRRMTASDAYRQAKGRDMSSVAIVDEASFTAGIERLDREAQRSATIRDCFAILECTAVRA